MNAGKNYFKSDYVSRQIIRGFFSYTISCTAVLFIWLLYSMEQFLSMLSFEGMLGLIQNFVIYYLIGLLSTWDWYIRSILGGMIMRRRISGFIRRS